MYVPPPIPVFSWTGFYIGGDIGYAFGKDTAFKTGGGNFGPFNVGQHDGIIGGGHIGYNLSTQSFPLLGGIFTGGGAVIGIEADGTGSDYRGHIGADAAGNSAFESVSNAQGSVRGRLGIAADRALFFVTGGAAVAEFRDNYNLGNRPFATESHDRLGWTVGGGIEYALTTNWSLRGEYRYSDFGTFSDRTYGGLQAPVYNISHRNIMQRATVGFSYKFESPMAAPVVARY